MLKRKNAKLFKTENKDASHQSRQENMQLTTSGPIFEDGLLTRKNEDDEKLDSYNKSSDMKPPLRTSHYAWFNSICYHAPPGIPPGICNFVLIWRSIPHPRTHRKRQFPTPGTPHRPQIRCFVYKA